MGCCRDRVRGCGVGHGGNDWSVFIVILILLFAFFEDEDSSSCF